MNDECLNIKVIRERFTIGSQNFMRPNGAMTLGNKVIFLL